MNSVREANASDWSHIENGSLINAKTPYSLYRALVELRARVEALEARQQPQDKLDRLIAQDRAASEVQPGGLVERARQALINTPHTLGDWKPEAHAVIREVAAWLDGRLEIGAAHLLREEANNG